MSDDDRWLWCDIESSGLDENASRAAILEVGLAVTTTSLDIVADASWVLPNPHLDPTTLPTVVRDMHTASGLLAAVTCPMPQLEAFKARRETVDAIHAWLNLHGAYAMTWAGSSLHFDLRWLARRMPLVAESRTAYRVIDVSTYKETLRAWAPDVVASVPAPVRAHRALSDIHDSIAELRHYRQALHL